MNVCDVVTCEKPAHAKGFCSVHYERWKKNGDPNNPGRYSRGTIEERLRYTSWVVTEAGCWEWCGGKRKGGYGRLTFGGKSFVTSRLAYETWVGSIPEGYVVRHKCDNPPCINPEHLEVGTHKDNTRDKMSRNRLRVRSGSSHGQAKLLESDVRFIRQEYSKGHTTQKMLGDLYGVSQTTISHIILGKVWRGVQ